MRRKLLEAGAEASIFLVKDIVIKERIPKSYRIPEIDNKLRGYRTRREAKIIDKLQRIGFPVPKLIEQDEKQTISMEFIKGPKLRDIFEKSDYIILSREIGEKIAILHNNTIIHGDLTTSNMILNDIDKQIYFIDFGLSFFSHKIEDKAVDLHLLKEGLESKHYKIWQECFKVVLDIYKKHAKDADLILKRLEQVELRGRYKRKMLNIL